MHRRFQFGLRENPASDRRHGSRLAVRTDELSHYAKGEENDAGCDGQNEGTSAVLPDAARCAVTGEEKGTLASEELGREHRHRNMLGRQAFEPLVGSMQAARLLGNIHVKTLQRYARPGRVPGYQIAGHWYFRESELDAWLHHQLNSNRQSVR
jgi:helix-turn-helix protein